MKIVRDRDGWTAVVIAESLDGVVVDWCYVDPNNPLRFIPHGEYEVVADVFLQRAKNIAHECKDPRMIDWCIRNLREGDFEFVRGTGFGCSCETALQDEDGMLVIGVSRIRPQDNRWEEWMNELNDQEIRVYYCRNCGEWAIDNDF